ncbi:MAG: DHH family phosphoesterase [Christensenellales bacterium]
MTVREMTIAETAELLREKDDILIVCHAHPDGDAVGCGVALERMLTSIGKTAYLICADVLPHHLRFLLGYRVRRVIPMRARCAPSGCRRASHQALP